MPPLFFALFAQLGGDDPELPDLLEVETASIALLARTSSAAATPDVACRPACGAGHRCLPSDRGRVCVADVHLGSGVGVERMGRAGQWVIDSSLDLGLSQSWGGPAGAEIASLSLQPVASYFFVDNLALLMGLGLDFGVNNDSLTVVIVSGTAGLRYYVDLGYGFGLWPGVEGLVGWAHASSGRRSVDEMALAVTVQAPALLHVAPQAFVGFGPKFECLWFDDEAQLNLALAFLLGFYL